MTKISDLPLDLVEEVLSRLPVTFLRAIRFTCKKWNTITNHGSFTKKQIGQAKAKAKLNQEEFQVIMTMDNKVYLMSVNLDGIHKDDNVESSIKQKAKLISLNHAYLFVQPQVFHCSGLLLCITGNESRLVIRNPYSGQTRWIEHTDSYHVWNMYALGYEMKNKSHRIHKILRFREGYDMSLNPTRYEFQIYNLNSNSWKVVDVTPDWFIRLYQCGVSLNGNTYWLALKKIPLDQGEMLRFLLCFDLTTEKFGPRLPLPFHTHISDTLFLSSVREEQLAVLFHRWCWDCIEIWISNKIEPNAVSWSKLFLAVGTLRLVPNAPTTFFVDQEKKVAVVFGQGKRVLNPTRCTTYIAGENGYIKQVDLGEFAPNYCFPRVCSYVPSSVQI